MRQTAHADRPVGNLTNTQYLLALWRSIYQLGIKGVERVHYWKLWLWTLFHKPGLFPQAIELAIYGYHFRRVCELHG